MTVLTANDSNTALYLNTNFSTVWHNLVQRIGFPVDTDGVQVKTIAGFLRRVNASPNNLVSLTEDTANYRTNSQWFTIHVG